MIDERLLEINQFTYDVYKNVLIHTNCLQDFPDHSNILNVPTLANSLNICNGLMLADKNVLVVSEEDITTVLRELLLLPSSGQVIIMIKHVPNMLKQYISFIGIRMLKASKFKSFESLRRDRKLNKVLLILDE